MPPRAPLTFLSSRGRALQATETTLQTICALDTTVSSLPFLGEPPSSSASSSSSDNSFPPTYTPPSPSFLLPLSQFPPAKTEHLPESMLPQAPRKLLQPSAPWLPICPRLPVAPGPPDSWALPGSPHITSLSQCSKTASPTMMTTAQLFWKVLCGQDSGQWRKDRSLQLPSLKYTRTVKTGR